MPTEIHQPEQQPNSELKPIDTTSSPDIGNTPVVGSQCHGTLTPDEFNSLDIVITDKTICESQIALGNYYLGGFPISNSKS